MKEFFKPTKGKLIIFGFLFILYVVSWFLSDQPGMDVPVGLNLIWLIFIILFMIPFMSSEVKTGIGGVSKTVHATMWVVAHILSLAVLYFASCLIMAIFNLFRKRRPPG